jgi:hypothetical protein
MHQLKLAAALAAGLLSAAAAPAATVNLDFNGTTGFASVADFYNGGTDSAGASGANYGVSFTGSVISLANDGTGPGASGQFFTGAPTTNVIFANANDPAAAIMNVASGFNTSFGFTYSSVLAPTTVTVFSGLNGSGSVLATFTLTSNSDGCAAGTPACVWSTVSKTFDGTAESVDFSSNAGNALFTNINYAVPLPASGLLLSFGVAGLALVGKRRRAA